MHWEGEQTMWNPEYRAELDSWADSHREEMVRDLETLVRIDSTKQEPEEGMPFGRGPAQAIACMEKLMTEAGLKTRNYENYCIAGDLAAEGEKSLDILAHLDVVPASKDWTKTQPFEPKVEGHYIYGRGTSDDKGPAVAALYALRAVRELGLPLKHGVRLICGADEECGSSDLEYYYAREKEAEYTFSPDASYPLINIEKARLEKKIEGSYEESSCTPSLLSIQAGSKSNVIPGTAEAVFAGADRETIMEAAKMTEKETGVSVSIAPGADGETGVRVTVRGRTGHAASPEGAVNALTALLDLICRMPLCDTELDRMIKSLAGLFPFGDHHGKALGVDLKDDRSGELTISLNMLTAQNGHLSADFDCRAPLCATEENLTEVIREKCSQAGLLMEEGGMTPAHAVSEDSGLVRTLLSCYERYFGKPGKALAIGGGTYVHELERGVAFGCEVEGVDNHMHGDDEFMDIEVMVMSCKIFADAILQLCG